MIYRDIQIFSARLYYTDCPCGLAALLHIMMFPLFVCTCRRSAMDRARATSDTDNNTLYPVIHYTTNVLHTRPPHSPPPQDLGKSEEETRRARTDTNINEPPRPDDSHLVKSWRGECGGRGIVGNHVWVTVVACACMLSCTPHKVIA